MFPSQEEVRRIRERYPVGAKVVVDHMGYDPHPIPDGTKGMVQHVDDAGTVHIRKRKKPWAYSWRRFLPYCEEKNARRHPRDSRSETGRLLGVSEGSDRF